MTILNLPDSAKITKRQKCPVKALDASSYTLRSGYAPLAEITVEIDILEQVTVDALIAQLEAARGVDFLELPYLSTGEHFLVQEYKTAPLLQGVYSNLSLVMVQQRSGVVPEDSSLFRCLHVPLYDSGQTNAFRNIAQQFKSGYQATKARGDKSAEQYWDVVFHLSPTEAALLDQQLVARRGIYSFNWSPIGDQSSQDIWLCAEWQIEYFVYGLYIFSGKFLKVGTSSAVTVIVDCDPFYSNVLALLPLKNGFQEVKNNLSTYNTQPIINSLELDPFGNPGVAQFNGSQGFKLASNTLDLNSDFSIEFWIKPTEILVSGDFAPGYLTATLLDLRFDSQNATPFNFFIDGDLRVTAGWVRGTAGDRNYVSSPNKVILNQWNYINISRQGTTFTVHANGVLAITISNVTGNLSSNSTDWFIGGFKPSASFDFKGLKGFMFNWRLTNIVRDGSIIPDKPFANIICTPTFLCDPEPSNTLSLINFNSQYSATERKFNRPTVIGGQINTTIADPFGGNAGVLELSGTQYAELNMNSSEDSTCLEFFVRHTVINIYLLEFRNVANEYNLFIYSGTAGSLNIWDRRNGNVTIYSSVDNVFSINRWDFVKIDYAPLSGHFICRVNGVIVLDAMTYTGGIIFPVSLKIGNSVDVPTNSSPTRYFSNLRISRLPRTENSVPIKALGVEACIESLGSD